MDIQHSTISGNKSGVDFGSVENSLAKCPGTKSKLNAKQRKKMSDEIFRVLQLKVRSVFRGEGRNGSVIFYALPSPPPKKKLPELEKKEEEMG